MTDSPPIDIRLNDFGTYAWVSGTGAWVVKQALSFHEVSVSSDGGPLHLTRRATWLGHFANGQIYFPAKLAPLVADALKKAGFRPRVRWPGYSPPAGPSPASAPSPRGRPAGGVFRDNARSAPDRLVPELCRNQEQSRTVVAARNNSEVDRWRNRLLAAGLTQPVVRDHEFDTLSVDAPRVHVTTLFCLDAYPFWALDRVIVPDAEPLLGVAPPPVRLVWETGEWRRRHYRHLWRWCVPAFGFLPAGVDPRGGDLLRLLGMFGRVFDPPDDRMIVRVVAFTPPRSGRWAADEGDHAKRRKQLWMNDSRNVLVARVANAFVSADKAALKPFGLDRFAGPAGRKVGVLVESTEHALALRRCMPGCQVLSAIRSKIHRVDTDQLILTDAYAYLSRDWGVDIVVDARGASPVTFPTFPPRTRGGGRTGEITLVDVADNRPDAAEQRSKDRLREYANRGWTVTGPAARLLAR